MTSMLEFFENELDLLGDSKREFLELGRVAGRFPVASHRNRDGSDGSEISVWCSNDYLGMGQSPIVLEAMKSAIDRFGAGSGGSRNIAGTNHVHIKLERALADLHGKESALLFTSGYTANEGSLSVLAGRNKDTVVFSDEKNHASIIDGIRHSGAEKHVFRHNDVDHLESLLSSVDPRRPKLIVFESVYSMGGDVAPVADLARIAQRFDATTYVDEVHAVGMYGPSGAGIAAREGLADSFSVYMGTLAKGFGTVGGYIAGPTSLIEAVRSFSRSFIFTTSLPPAIAAGALASVEHLRVSDYERGRLQDNARLLHRLLDECGIAYNSSMSHIVSVRVGDERIANAVSADLLRKYQIYVQDINAPSVPKGQELLRVAPSATHTSDDVKDFVSALDAIWTAYDLPRISDADSR